MNKKFSTLMAGLMLASAFSVADAQTAATKYEDGKYYLLGNSSAGKYISVNSTPGAQYGTLQYADVDANNDGTTSLEETRNALWKVTVTKENEGNAPKYSFVNVATGQVLSVLVPSDNNGGTIPNATIAGGGFMEWYNGLSSTAITADNEFMSYVGQNDVIYLTAGSGSSVTVKRDDVAAAQGDATMIKIQPYKAAIVELGANELNKELIMNSEDDKSFTLSFNRDVTEGAENLFTGVELVAVQLWEDGSGNKSEEQTTTYNTKSDYVRLHVKDTKNYLVVDTTLHAGSEAMKQLPEFAYDDPNKEVVDGNNVKRNPKSFNFKFAYDPTDSRLLIKVEEWTKKISSRTPNAVSGTYTGDGNTAYTYWDYSQTTNNVPDAYVRLVELSSVRELTVASEQADGGTTGVAEWTVGNNQGADDLENGMLTTVTIGAGLNSYIPTTIPTGLYLIQYKGSNKADAATDNYYIANLGGWFGYAEQAVRQNFDHMPAAQWYVEQQGEIATAPVTITNREFFDNANGGATGNDFGRNGNRYQAFQGPDGNYFFLSGAFANDTLKFIPVSAESKADSILGYKHVDAAQAAVETYVFNYLHGLSLDNGLNTPSDKDSLVRVDENGAKASFRLVPVVEHDSYGLQLNANEIKATGINNLIRNAYYVQAYDNSKFEGDRYLTYDKASKKYVMSTTPTPYFLKENNCIDGTHYYALVEANLFVREAVKNSGSKIAQLLNRSSNVTLYPAEFAGKNIDDLTAEEETLSYNAQFQALDNNESIWVPFYAANGTYIVEDGSQAVALYAYQANSNGDIELRRVNDGNNPAKYYYMNKVNTNDEQLGDNFYSWNYADSRVSVDDNTLDLTNAELEDKWMSEIRVSAFEVAINDSPLYRRFNGAAPETYGDASNAPLNLKFFRFNNNAEYLFENQSADNAYRDGISDKSISFLGVNNAFQYPESETRSYTMFVDTAYVRYNTPMPQYLIGIRPEVVPGDTIWCNATSAHHHETLADSLACDHTVITAGFTRAMYLFNAQDSIDAKNYDYQGKAAYGAQTYTRLAFKDAVHAGDTLYILNPGVTTEQLINSDLKNEDLFADKLFLGNNKHKNVVFQFRLIDEDNNRFLIESEAEQNGAAVLNKDLQNVSIAPMRGGWIKIQNGVPVIARFQDFNEAIAQADVFDVNDEITYDATANDEVAVESVKVIAGDGQVTIMGAAGKNVTITTVLGKTVVAKTIASDNETIAVPTTGIVAVAVEGEEAIMTIVK